MIHSLPGWIPESPSGPHERSGVPPEASTRSRSAATAPHRGARSLRFYNPRATPTATAPREEAEAGDVLEVEGVVKIEGITSFTSCSSLTFQVDRLKRPAHSSGNSGWVPCTISSLPEHTWCSITQYQDVVGSIAVMRCNWCLRGALQAQPVWRFHALGSAACARPVHPKERRWWRAGAGDGAPFGGGAAPTPAFQDVRLHWRWLVQANRCRDRGASAHIWVRVERDMEVRMPLPRPTAEGLAELKERLRGVLLDPDAPAVARGGRGPEALGSLRLRHMQWDGRPGTVVPPEDLMAGSRYYLECALRGAGGRWEWPLPPARPSPSQQPVRAPRPGRAARSPSTWSLSRMPAFWQCRVQRPEASPPPEEPPISGRHVLVRVTSRLLPQERWVGADLDAPLSALIRELCDLLPPEIQQGASVDLQLVDSTEPSRSSRYSPAQELRSLFWTQSETLVMELEGGGVLLEEGQTHAKVLVRRERAFEHAGSARAAEEPAWQSGIWEQEHDIWTRHMSAPAALLSAEGGRVAGGDAAGGWGRPTVSSLMSAALLRARASEALLGAGVPRPTDSGAAVTAGAGATAPARDASLSGPRRQVSEPSRLRDAHRSLLGAARGPYLAPSAAVAAAAGDCPAMDMDEEEEQECGLEPSLAAATSRRLARATTEDSWACTQSSDDAEDLGAEADCPQALCRPLAAGALRADSAENAAQSWPAAAGEEAATAEAATAAPAAGAARSHPAAKGEEAAGTAPAAGAARSHPPAKGQEAAGPAPAAGEGAARSHPAAEGQDAAGPAPAAEEGAARSHPAAEGEEAAGPAPAAGEGAARSHPEAEGEEAAGPAPAAGEGAARSPAAEGEVEAAGPAPATGALVGERVVKHTAPVLLPSTLRIRQFEFHPSLDVILTGDRTGRVNVMSPSTERQVLSRPALLVGPTPVLALTWLRRHPESAICGSARSGRISFLRYDTEAASTEQALRKVHHAAEFPQLSSLSANCTDDFLVASGISPDVSVYDIQTGQLLLQAPGVHEHLINISRFCHTSPHIFATASFDHTCRVWDLRQPITRDHPVKTLHTGSCNVMCSFSPDDSHLLCSGVDTHISQFEVPSWQRTPECFPLREPTHHDRYRRAIYLESGQHFVTAATEEAHLNVMSVGGENIGVVDFQYCGQYWQDGVLQVCSIDPEKPGTPTGPVSAASAALDARAAAWEASERLRHAEQSRCTFIQSVRAHPCEPGRLGVLLCPDEGDESCIALVDLDPHDLAGR